MGKYIALTEEEFKKQLRDYPNKLDRDVCGISEPPQVSYNDFSGKLSWPESRMFVHTLGKKDYHRLF